MDNSRVTNHSFINRGERDGNWRHRSSTSECADWLQEQLHQRPSKEIADKTGAGIRAAENVKQGRNGLTMAHLVSMCRADPLFRAEFFKYCGGQLEGEPEMLAGLTLAVQSFMRSQKQGADK